MAGNDRLVLEKVYAFKSEAVLDIILSTASRRKWYIIEREDEGDISRLTLSLAGSSTEFRLVVSGREPRKIGGRFSVPQTSLTVWAGGASKEEMDSISRSLQIAFFRGGG